MKISTGLRRRQAIAGIVSAVIFFAIFFTAGTGFFLVVNQLRDKASDASLGRLSQQAEASVENLSLGVTLSIDGDLVLSVNNTGGVPSTIESIFVTNTSGDFISQAVANSSRTSLGSSFLTGEPGLSIDLPLTLGEGATTSGIGTSIEIVGANISSSGVVFVNVLTKLGNVFSAPYPQLRQLTYKDVVEPKNLVNQVNNGEDIDQTDLNEIVVSCLGCASGVYVGGEILILQLTATPSPVNNHGQIDVTAKVTDYSAYTAADVLVDLNSLDAGTASVSPSSQQCGGTTSISSLSSASFSCTFEAIAGESGGSVVFNGTASACVLSPSTVSPCTSGTPAYSSPTGSNPVQIGPSISYGVWQMNYYYFGYTSSTQHPTPVPISIISDTSEYVTFYVSVTNTYSEPLTLLDGTFMQSDNPGDASFNLFMVDSVTYPASGTPTITPYECVDAPPAAPYSLNGGPCLIVAPGATITIEFASSAPESTTWEWGGGGLGAATQGGNTILTLIAYAADNGGVYSIASSNIPFMQVYVS